MSIASREIMEACTAYAAQLIRFQRAQSVSGWFQTLVLFTKHPKFAEEDLSGEPLSYPLFSAFMHDLGASRRYRVQRLKQWYVWCCDQGMPRFDADTAFRLGETTFGGNEKAKAVLSSDPEEGPLSDVEVVALLNALRASEESGSLTLQERAAVWLCVALGANAQQYVLLRDGDLERIDSTDGSGAVYQIRVPRMKKRHVRERTEFKVRKLIPELGVTVEALLAESRRKYGSVFRGMVGDDVAVPLFLRDRLSSATVNESMREYTLSMTGGEFTALVSRAVKRLAVISPRTGRLLHATCRRFRYTFATRLVREGASQRVVAEALDHTDLQNVQCYFDLKSDIVEKLDAAMALALGPLSQAFLGHLVHGEVEAVRGDRRSSRIYHHRRAARKVEAVGTCGSFSFCGLTAPVACYTCIKFQPWMDAPHEEVLADLLAERARREASGLDGKMVALFDNTVLAVADVVTRIEAARRAGAA